MCDLTPSALAFAAEARFGGRNSFDMAAFIEIWDQLIEDGTAHVLVIRDGGIPVAGIGGFVAPEFTTGALAATEGFFYALPGFRGKGYGSALLRRFELWAIAQGANYIKTSYAHKTMPAYMQEHYSARGYTAHETVYTRSIHV
jgi:GNAT superfamily N-acetyltransferase